MRRGSRNISTSADKYKAEAKSLRPVFLESHRQLAATVQLRQQAKEFQVKPYQCYHQAIARVPLHKDGYPLRYTTIDPVKIKEQVECGDADNNYTDPDRERGRT